MIHSNYGIIVLHHKRLGRKAFYGGRGCENISAWYAQGWRTEEQLRKQRAKSYRAACAKKGIKN